ncbi:MAG: acylneuraminate cytidylyltransferase family protein [Deltaproteobacteria bacterium]|nr:acylneuraminate cytidylyltransferase family protein [Deltaproteobacteria bacterium]
MSILCVIGARGDSKGLPGKNIRLLLGKPLIVWSVEQALCCPEITRVVVSTNSEEIVAIARKAGAEAPFLRPWGLATDRAGKFQVWQHALVECERYYGEKYECFVDLDCTNPLRDVADISSAVQQFRESRKRGVDAVLSVCLARKNPYFNMLEVNPNGALRVCKDSPKPIVRRQDAPTVYDHVASIYVLDPAYLRRASCLLEGHVEGYDIGAAKSFDVDSELDFRIIEMLMKDKFSTAS